MAAPRCRDAFLPPSSLVRHRVKSQRCQNYRYGLQRHRRARRPDEARHTDTHISGSATTCWGKSGKAVVRLVLAILGKSWTPMSGGLPMLSGGVRVGLVYRTLSPPVKVRCAPPASPRRGAPHATRSTHRTTIQHTCHGTAWWRP